MSQIKNRKHCLSTKTNTRRADEWNGGQFFCCCCFQPEKKWPRENLLCSHKYELIFTTLYIFQTTILEQSCCSSIWQFFFHLVVKDILKKQTTALEGLPAIFCLMQTGTLWWNGLAVFYQRNKWLHQNIHCWHKYELIFVALYILQMTIRGRIQVATVDPMKMLIPINHKHYVEADKLQLRSSFPS